MIGFGETKEYSLQHALKKSVNYFNVNVNEMLNSRFCLHSTILFRTFALSNNEGYSSHNIIKQITQMKKIALVLLFICVTFNLAAQDYYFDILHPKVTYRMYKKSTKTYDKWQDNFPPFIKDVLEYENETLYLCDGFRLRYMKFYNVQEIYTKIGGELYPTFYGETTRENSDGSTYVIKVHAVYETEFKCELKYLKLTYPLYEIKIEYKE